MFEEVHLAPAIRSLKDDLVGDVRKVLWVLMGNGGKRVNDIGIIRATSAVAWPIVIPGFGRAIARKAELPEKGLAAIEPIRHDERHFAIEEPERVGQDADDFSWAAVEHHHAANHGRVGAELRPPVPGRQDDRLRTSQVRRLLFENNRPSIGCTPSIGRMALA